MPGLLAIFDDCLSSIGEAEKEVLTLAPHFEAKLLPESFDTKLDRLNLAATQDLTWLHLLSTITFFLFPSLTRISI